MKKLAKKSDKNRLIRLWAEEMNWTKHREPPGRKDRGSGIYVLYKKGVVYYIGLSTSSMRGRLGKHAIRDRHKGKWDAFSFYQIRRPKYVKDIETLLLRICRPPGNRVLGRPGRKYNHSRQNKKRK